MYIVRYAYRTETKIFLLRIQLKGTICQANIDGTNKQYR